MKPCDCKDGAMASELNEQGIGFNEWQILVEPLFVYIQNATTKIRIPQNRFKAFAEWYLEDQFIPGKE